MCSSKKGISSHQPMRTLNVTYKTARFMTHRIREAMKSGALPLSRLAERWKTQSSERDRFIKAGRQLDANEDEPRPRKLATIAKQKPVPFTQPNDENPDAKKRDL